jgi:hypothetical protein
VTALRTRPDLQRLPLQDWEPTKQTLHLWAQCAFTIASGLPRSRETVGEPTASAPGGANGERLPRRGGTSGWHGVLLLLVAVGGRRGEEGPLPPKIAWPRQRVAAVGAGVAGVFVLGPVAERSVAVRHRRVRVAGRAGQRSGGAGVRGRGGRGLRVAADLAAAGFAFLPRVRVDAQGGVGLSVSESALHVDDRGVERDQHAGVAVAEVVQARLGREGRQSTPMRGGDPITART